MRAHGQMVCHGILRQQISANGGGGREGREETHLDDLEQLLFAVDAADGEPMEQLDHESREALECARDADVRIDLNQYALCGVDVDLEPTSFV